MIDWLDLLAVKGTLKSLLQHHSSEVLILHHLRLLYGPVLISVNDYWKNHSFDYADLCYLKKRTCNCGKGASQVAVKNPSVNAGDSRDSGSIPGSGRSLGRMYGNPLQYSHLKIPFTEEPGGLQSMESQRVRLN